MQAFEFAKELLIDLRRQKKELLAAQGDVSASEDKPIELKVALGNVDYDDEELPVKSLTITVSIGAGDKETLKDYILEIPPEVHLYQPSEINPWLEALFKFTAKAHEISMLKSKINEDSITSTEVSLDKDEWTINWKTTEGLLSDIPVESASQQLDVQQRRVLEGWKDPPTRWDDNPDDPEVYVEKTFKSGRQADVSMELMYQLLLINGRSDEELSDYVKIYKEGDGHRVRIPKEYIDDVRTSEMYFGI